MVSGRIRVLYLYLFILSLSLLCPRSLFAVNEKNVKELLVSGTINWSKGTIIAAGSGAPPSSAASPAQGRLMAKRAAVLDARRNLLETVRGVRVDAVSTILNHMAVSDKVVTRVSGMVKLSRVIDTRYLSGGVVEVTVEMDLRGDLLNLMLEETKETRSDYISGALSGKESPHVSQIPSVERPRTKPSMPPPPPQIPSVQTEVKDIKQEEKKEVKTTKKEIAGEDVQKEMDLSKLNYSGLVVDARRLRLRPALIPKIIDQRGGVVYSAANMARRDAVKMGVVGYAKDLGAAKKNRRVTATPFVIKGIKAAGKKRTDVQIKNRDSGIIRGSDQYTNYLKKGRVLIVYD